MSTRHVEVTLRIGCLRVDGLHHIFFVVDVRGCESRPQQFPGCAATMSRQKSNTRLQNPWCVSTHGSADPCPNLPPTFPHSNHTSTTNTVHSPGWPGWLLGSTRQQLCLPLTKTTVTCTKMFGRGHKPRFRQLCKSQNNCLLSF